MFWDTVQYVGLCILVNIQGVVLCKHVHAVMRAMAECCVGDSRLPQIRRSCWQMQGP